MVTAKAAPTSSRTDIAVRNALCRRQPAQGDAGKMIQSNPPDRGLAGQTGGGAGDAATRRLEVVHIPSPAPNADERKAAAAADERKAAAAAKRKAAAAERKAAAAAAKRKAEAAEADAKRKAEADAKYNRTLLFNQQWLENNPGKTIEDLYRGVAAMKQSLQDKDVISRTLTFTTGYATGFREAQNMW